MSNRTKGRLNLVFRALSPLHHGGETMGNVQLFRRRPTIDQDGDEWDVPYISGNSFKHWLRENAAYFALDALGIDDGDLKSKVVQLLFSGGALTKSGQSVRLDKARKAESLLPVLSLHGYSAGNTMTNAAIKVDHLDLACLENRVAVGNVIEEYHEDLTGHLDNPGSEYLDTEFGTRHEPTRDQQKARYVEPEEMAEIEERVSEQKDDTVTDKGDSVQMYHEYEVLVDGSVLVGGVSFQSGLTDLQLQALRSAFAYGSEGRAPDGGLICRIGGLTAKGFGRVSLHLHGEIAEGSSRLTNTATMSSRLLVTDSMITSNTCKPEKKSLPIRWRTFYECTQPRKCSRQRRIRRLDAVYNFCPPREANRFIRRRALSRWTAAVGGVSATRRQGEPPGPGSRVVRRL